MWGLRYVYLVALAGQVALVSSLLCYLTLMLSEPRADARLDGEKVRFGWLPSLIHGSNHKMYNRIGEAYSEKRPQNYVKFINTFDHWWDVKPLRNFEPFNGQVWLTPSSDEYLLKDVPLSRNKEIVFDVDAVHSARVGFFRRLSDHDRNDALELEAVHVRQAELKHVDVEQLEAQNRSRATNKPIYEIMIGSNRNTRSEVHVHGNVEAYTTPLENVNSGAGVWPQVSSDPEKLARPPLPACPSYPLTPHFAPFHRDFVTTFECCVGAYYTRF